MRCEGIHSSATHLALNFRDLDAGNTTVAHVTVRVVEGLVLLHVHASVREWSGNCVLLAPGHWQLVVPRCAAYAPAIRRPPILSLIRQTPVAMQIRASRDGISMTVDAAIV